MKRAYTVVNISPRMTEEEKDGYVNQIAPTLINALGKEHLREVNRNEPVQLYEIKEKEMPRKSEADTMAVKAARKFINENHNYYIW